MAQYIENAFVTYTDKWGDKRAFTGPVHIEEPQQDDTTPEQSHAERVKELRNELWDIEYHADRKVTEAGPGVMHERITYADGSEVFNTRFKSAEEELADLKAKSDEELAAQLDAEVAAAQARKTKIRVNVHDGECTYPELYEHEGISPVVHEDGVLDIVDLDGRAIGIHAAGRWTHVMVDRQDQR